MQAPVTQETDPGRIRQSGWYFRRERGINCSRKVLARLGKVPTDGWREPSGLRRPNPITPGAVSGSASYRSTRATTCPSAPSGTSTSGLSTK